MLWYIGQIQDNHRDTFIAFLLTGLIGFLGGFIVLSYQIAKYMKIDDEDEEAMGNKIEAENVQQAPVMERVHMGANPYSERRLW